MTILCELFKEPVTSIIQIQVFVTAFICVLLIMSINIGPLFFLGIESCFIGRSISFLSGVVSLPCLGQGEISGLWIWLNEIHSSLYQAFLLGLDSVGTLPPCLCSFYPIGPERWVLSSLLIVRRETTI